MLGSFLTASARWLSAASSALVTEAEACQDGLRLVLSRQEFRNVVLETNLIQLVSLWNSQWHQLSEIAVILQEMEAMIQPLSSFCVAHVKRTTNNAAICVLVKHLRLGLVCFGRINLLAFFYPRWRVIVIVSFEWMKAMVLKKSNSAENMAIRELSLGRDSNGDNQEQLTWIF
jgi:hypothetical protein